MATDGDIDCSAYSKAKTVESLRNIDRARFPKNLERLERRLKELETGGHHSSPRVEFEIQDDPEAAAEATRRGILRGFSWGGVVPAIVTVPVAATAMAYATYTYKSTLGAILLVLFLLGLAELYFLRPLTAKRLATLSPTRRISVSADGIAISSGGPSSAVPWEHYRNVLEEERFFLLGGGTSWAYIPKTQMPPEAIECIRQVINERAA